MGKKKSGVLMVLLAFTFPLLVPLPARALTGNAAAQSWYSKFELNGNDWKVTFLIPKNVRQNGFVVQSSGDKENLVVSRSTFERLSYSSTMDKVIMTTGFRARFFAFYEFFPHSDIKLNSFACSLRIYYWT
ncbi:MAG TPA: hypothetical protein VFD58_08345 [Blastocatellia bacterium]|nr:hypothetical protein [Blastocatellia bacterium]